MAAKRYTKCVKPADFADISPESIHGKVIIGLGIAQVVGILGLYGWAAFTPAMSKPAIWATILLVLQLIAFVTWWLDGRLICLNEKDRTCAIIGRVRRPGLSSAFKGGDDDYTMDLLLAPGQEHLLAINPKITGIGRSYTTDPEYHETLHCEFEGDGIYQIREYLYIILALLFAALFLPWPFDLFVFVIALIVGIIGGIKDFRSPDNASNPGNPLDIDPYLGNLEHDDLVVISGEWIYDSLHVGWHEIHPVMTCKIVIKRTKLSVPMNEDAEWSDYKIAHPLTGLAISLDDPDNVELYRKHECGLKTQADEIPYDDRKEDPGNDWVIHPLVDGCKKAEIIL